MGGRRLCLDPGHGGADPGAVPGVSKVDLRWTEANLNLDVCYLLSGYLTQKRVPLDVSLTRTSDETIPRSWRLAAYHSLLEACEIAKEPTPIFISIHHNSAVTPARGVEIFTWPDKSPLNEQSDLLAEDILQVFLREDFTPLRSDARDRDLDKHARFQVLRPHETLPSIQVLVEVEFINTNPTLYAYLNNRMRYIHAIAEGIQSFIWRLRGLTYET